MKCKKLAHARDNAPPRCCARAPAPRPADTQSAARAEKRTRNAPAPSPPARPRKEPDARGAPSGGTAGVRAPQLGARGGSACGRGCSGRARRSGQVRHSVRPQAWWPPLQTPSSPDEEAITALLQLPRRQKDFDTSGTRPAPQMATLLTAAQEWWKSGPSRLPAALEEDEAKAERAAARAAKKVATAEALTAAREARTVAKAARTAAAADAKAKREEAKVAKAAARVAARLKRPQRPPPPPQRGSRRALPSGRGQQTSRRAPRRLRNCPNLGPLLALTQLRQSLPPSEGARATPPDAVPELVSTVTACHMSGAGGGALLVPYSLCVRIMAQWVAPR